MQSISNFFMAYWPVMLSLYLALVFVKLWIVRDDVTVFSVIIHKEHGAYESIATAKRVTWILASLTIVLAAWAMLLREGMYYFVAYDKASVVTSARIFGKRL